MSSEDFAKRINKIMVESGYQSYGMPSNNMPVQEAVWPGSQTVPPAQATVTDGSTTPLGEPRQDIAAQENGGEEDQEVVGEVASLLISMGYILQMAGVLEDKYDTQGVIEFLNNITADGCGDDVEVDVVAGAPNEIPPSPESSVQNGSPQPATPIVLGAPVTPAPEVTPVVDEKKNPYMESRKLLESRIKLVLKKK